MERESLIAFINVAQLLKEPTGSSQNHDVSGIISEEVEGFVEGKAKVIRTSRGVLVQCELNAEVKLICSRCLDAFLCPIGFTARCDRALVMRENLRPNEIVIIVGEKQGKSNERDDSE